MEYCYINMVELIYIKSLKNIIIKFIIINYYYYNYYYKTPSLYFLIKN